ncbi:MAG: ATP-binding protein [Myxococcota bacterium]
MTGAQAPEAPPEDPLRPRLLRLMVARLALALLVLAVALSTVGVREGGEAAERGLYGTMAAAFLASVLYALSFRSMRRLARFAAFQLATDVALLTSIVYFSGGKDSIFTFLQVLLIVYAAQLFGRPGAYLSAAAASLGYGAVLLSIESGWLPSVSEAAPSATPWFTLWGLHTGAWLLVALLSSTLSRELHRAGRELDQQRSDLEQLQHHHERTVESLTSGLLTTDRRGRVISFNGEAERITGVGPAQALGRGLEELLPGVGECMRAADGRVPGRTRARMEFVRTGGERLHLGIAVSVLRDVRRKPCGHVVIFQDVSDVVRMEGELRRSERLAAVGELSAGMAHEVRNPLAAISGSIEMLRGGLGEGEGDAEQRRLMDIVIRETDRLDSLIGEFLRFARPAPPRLESVELAGLVEDLLQVFASELPEGVEVRAEIPAGLQVLADADQVRQLLWNLLLNAAQATEKAGWLRLRARPAPGPLAGGARLPAQELVPAGRKTPEDEGPSWVEVSVTDSGRGIPPEVLERMFEPFFTTRATGSGLGLATVHRIVEAHGGVLGVESVPGQGTEFRILLPSSEEKA